jgi:DNA-binding SARP family transcriptional activator
MEAWVADRHPHGRDALAELLWPGQPAAAARRSLRVALTTLRQALGEASAPIPFLIATRESLQVNPASSITLDSTTFASLLGESQRHLHPDGALCPACLARLSEAVTLYRGDFLQQLEVRDSLAFDEWVTLTRERLHRAVLEALAQLAAYHERRGEEEMARQYAWRTLALEGWDEAAHRCVMRVLSRKGQRSAALAQYERCCKVLAEELGVEPAAETTAPYAQIRMGSVARSVGNVPATIAPAPREGRTNEAGNERASAERVPHASTPSNLPTPPTPLIGREREVAALGALLRRPTVRMVTLTGVGGSGKTRLAVQAAAELALTSSPIAMAEGSQALSPPLLPQRERGPGVRACSPTASCLSTSHRSATRRWSSRRLCRHWG